MAKLSISIDCIALAKSAPVFYVVIAVVVGALEAVLVYGAMQSVAVMCVALIFAVSATKGLIPVTPSVDAAGVAGATLWGVAAFVLLKTFLVLRRA